MHISLAACRYPRPKYGANYIVKSSTYFSQSPKELVKARKVEGQSA